MARHVVTRLLPTYPPPTFIVNVCPPGGSVFAVAVNVEAVSRDRLQRRGVERPIE
jgi:hypothetical protein